MAAYEARKRKFMLTDLLFRFESAVKDLLHSIKKLERY
jgi:hypothetical protein